MAKVLLDLTDHGLNLLAIAQVAPHPQAASPVGFDFLRHAVNATPLPPDFSWRQILWRPLYVRKRNVCTLCCQFERRRATDAPHTPSARNQGYFALQSAHATPPLVPSMLFLWLLAYARNVSMSSRMAVRELSAPEYSGIVPTRELERPQNSCIIKSQDHM